MKIQGIEVPKLGFGTWQVKGEACREAVRHALDLGYRHIDTAQIYKNEEQVGQGILDAGIPRDEIFLVTKIWRDQFHRGGVFSSFEESLRKLQTDHVDLLLIHWPSDEVPFEETLGAMQELVEQGKARLIGVSNFTAAQFERACEIAPQVACNQVEYHPFLGQRRLRELATAHGAMLTAYSPIAQGEVLGDEVLREIAASHGKNAIQVTLRWLLQQDGVVAIPRSTNPAHRASNFDVFDFELSDEEMARIDALDRGQRLINPPWAPQWD